MQEQVSGALCALGESQPEEALRACEQYMRQQEKVSPEGGTCCGWGAGGRVQPASSKPRLLGGGVLPGR